MTGSQSGMYVRSVVAVAATLWLVVEARPVLEPLMIALLVWFMLNALASGFARLIKGPGARPGVPSRVLSGLAVVIGGMLLSVMTANSIASFRETLPTYEENLRAMVEAGTDALGFSGPLDPSALLGEVSMSDLLLDVVGSALGVTSSLVIVLVYVLFIFVEARAYPAKLAALAPDPEARDRLAALIGRIHAEIEAYIGVKCVVGLAQAVPTWVLLAAVGLDGAAFWAVVVFIFSFIPTVGSLIGIVFPSAIALAQFADPVTVPLIVLALAAIQLWGSNWLEPKLMGARLNLSALVILVGIFAGGAAWGIVGALVAVPLLSVAVIVFASIDRMRPVAVLLSSDGRIPETYRGPGAPG